MNWKQKIDFVSSAKNMAITNLQKQRFVKNVNSTRNVELAAFYFTRKIQHHFLQPVIPASVQKCRQSAQNFLPFCSHLVAQQQKRRRLDLKALSDNNQNNKLVRFQ